MNPKRLATTKFHFKLKKAQKTPKMGFFWWKMPKKIIKTIDFFDKVWYNERVKTKRKDFMKIAIYQAVQPTFRVDKNKEFYKIGDYNVIFEEDIVDALTHDISDNDFLENLFCRFNMGNYPESYKGHSLSVGDIVELDNRLYICCNCGWKQIKWLND